MKSSVFLRSLIGYVLITVLLAGLVLLFSFQMIRDHYIHTLANDLENLGITMRLKIAPIMEGDNVDTLDIAVKRLGADIETRITVIEPNGVVLADSEEDPKAMDNHRRRPEVAEALEGKVGQSVRFSRTVKQDMLYVAVPVERNGKIIGTLRVSLFLSEINSLLNDLRIKMLQIAAIIIIVSLGIAALLSRGLSKPISQLVNASRRVAAGDFDVSVLFKKEDELKELADSFNHMVSQIKTLIAELSHEKEALNSIISSIREGILVLDKKGKVVLSNDSLQRIVHTDTLKDKHYWKLIRVPKLSQLIDAVQHKEDAIKSGEIVIDGRTYMCSATYLSSAEQIVLTLHDITEIVRVARMKKEFVFNVSHELRTPLTAIKGFVETLEQEKGANSKHYLDIITRHTDRLINIVKDLQTLSQLEVDEKETLQLEDVNLEKLIDPILKMFDQELKKKNLTLTLDIAENLPHIKGDPFKLEQVLMNLIDNAIKYTEEGGIRISVGQNHSQIKIEIEDSGIGIPKEHLSRIFERFYVVDKSRSRKMGGTGLGLSIVKHIIHAHKGEIRVESEPRKGSKFTLFLPKSQ
jgi:two-component system phosphate regulon sensor histidine kinase PhoR